MDFLITLIIIVVNCYFCYKIGYHSAIKHMSEVYSKLTEGLVTEIFLETHPEGVFAYIKKDGKFLANGANFTGLFQTIKDQNPNKTFRVLKPEWASDADYQEIFKAAIEIFGADGDKK